MRLPKGHQLSRDARLRVIVETREGTGGDIGEDQEE
jgi:hypothetical protein